VRDPARTYPRALLGAVVLTSLTYLGPLAIAVACPTTAAAGAGAGGGAAVDPAPWEGWKAGSLSAIAQSIGGPALGFAMLFSSLVGNWGLFSAELLEDSTQLQGLSEMGLAPRCFRARHPVHFTPRRALWLQVALTAVLVGLDFTSLLTIDNFFSCLQSVLEFASCVRLRQTQPRMLRPFAIPLGTGALATMLLFPVAISAYVGVTALLESRVTLITNVVATAIGVIAGAIFVLRGGAQRAPPTEEDLVERDERDGIVHEH